MFLALFAMEVNNLWSHRGFLTRKMSRVAVIWIPRTASACQELLELLGLVRSWFVAWTGNCVTFILAIEVRSNWR